MLTEQLIKACPHGKTVDHCRYKPGRKSCFSKKTYLLVPNTAPTSNQSTSRSTIRTATTDLPAGNCRVRIDLRLLVSPKRVRKPEPGPFDRRANSPRAARGRGESCFQLMNKKVGSVVPVSVLQPNFRMAEENPVSNSDHLAAVSRRHGAHSTPPTEIRTSQRELVGAFQNDHLTASDLTA